MPYDTLFPGQEKDEKIIFFLRRHWLVFVKTLFVYVVLLILPWLLRDYIYSIYNLVLPYPNADVLLGLLTSFYYIYVLTFFYRAWVDYYLDVWIVTDERVVDIEQKGLFNRVIAAHRLYRIQDVRADVKGIWSTFFHYGDVHIQTAGSQGYFIFKQVPNPYAVTKELIALVDWKKKILTEEGVDVNN